MIPQVRYRADETRPVWSSRLLETTRRTLNAVARALQGERVRAWPYPLRFGIAVASYGMPLLLGVLAARVVLQMPSEWFRLGTSGIVFLAIAGLLAAWIERMKIDHGVRTDQLVSSGLMLIVWGIVGYVLLTLTIALVAYVRATL